MKENADIEQMKETNEEFKPAEEDEINNCQKRMQTLSR